MSNLLTRSISALLPGVMFPWSVTSSTLQALVYKDVYGTTDNEIVTRDSAMRVAPVKRGRAVIIGRLGDLPLELGEFVEGVFVADEVQPAHLTQVDGVESTPWRRFAWSLDDVLFTGWSLWAVDRDDAGAITASDRIARHLWRFDADSPTGVQIQIGLVWVNVTDDKSVLLFAGPDDGLLVNAHDSIVGWRHMERAWVGRVRNPIPLMVLREKEAGTVRQTEAQGYVDALAAGRLSPNGAIAFIPATLDLDVHGEVQADLFNEGRNAARIDIANHMNLPVSYLDGSTATSSLTYTTQEGSRAQIIDDLEYWLAPFEARLSQADVTGDPKKFVRVNRSNLTAVPNDEHGPNRDTPDAAPAPQTPQEDDAA